MRYRLELSKSESDKCKNLHSLFNKICFALMIFIHVGFDFYYKIINAKK